MQNPLNKNKINKKFSKEAMKWLAFVAAIFLIFVFGLIAATAVFQLRAGGKIYPGVIVGEVNIGGKTQAEALRILSERKEKLQSEGLIFKVVNETRKIDKEITVQGTSSATDPDLAQRIFYIDISSPLSEAYQYGRNRNRVQNLYDQSRSLLFGKKISIQYELNNQELQNILVANFDSLQNPAADASLIFLDGSVSVAPEKSGFAFSYEEAVKQAESNILALDSAPIEIVIVEQKPVIYTKDTAYAAQLAKMIISTSTPVLSYEGREWKISLNDVKDWLEFKKLDNGRVGLQFNTASTTEYLASVAKEIDVAAQDAKFKIVGKRASEFQASRDGKKLNLEKSFDKLNHQYFNEGRNEIELSVEIEPPKIRTADVNDLGIKELIGRGTSNFAGSPKNRRHNIAVGAEKLNGILIEPGEEFSLLAALGEVSAATGYLPELVIKGDRTIPEYGGGLCQIGTTTFRAALRSGLPITARRAHTYRVVYYEPAGMDATIYDPYPDMKFLNDTGAYILFTTKIEGDDLIFEFYGTSDGRSVEITPDPPKIFNITSPGAPKYIETDELAPGEKKLVERAHNGADTSFDYIVTYPDGEIKKQTFNSHYIAWQEVWLVGRQPATSTPEVLEEPIIQ